jgi:hypothetical protein
VKDVQEENCKERLTLQTEPDTMVSAALVQNFTESQKGREEEEYDTVIEAKWRVKTYQHAVIS